MKPNSLTLTFLLVLGLAAAFASGHTSEFGPDMNRTTDTMSVSKALAPTRLSATSTASSTSDPRLALGFASGCGGLALCAVSQAEARGAVALKNLRCEYRENPLGIDSLQPRLSWIITADDAAGSSTPARGVRQSAYHVLVASSLDLLARDQGDLWNSGKVATDQSIQVEYAGKPLATRQQSFWKVRVWDQNGLQSPWSEPASWTMGILDPADWKGQWIKAAQANSPRLPLFRKAFNVAKPLRRAELFICGLGCMEVRVNGALADDSVFEPGWTLYSKTCLYRVYDLTSRVTSGENVLGVMLGNGMYNVKGGRYTKFTGSFGPPKLRAQLHLDYADGTGEVLATDPTWVTAPGPITFSCVYGGEDYDARLEIAGWDKPGFPVDATWKAGAVATVPGGKLAGSTHSAPPVKVEKVLPVVNKIRLKPGVWVYDLGQNCSMQPRITVKGVAGAKISILTGERFEHGKFIGACDQLMSFNYTLRGGEAAETWAPRFCYAGTRYLQIEGAAAAGEATDGQMPVVLAVDGRFVCGSARPVGEFACSNETFNRTLEIIHWAIRSNMMSILTDCPHREKLGWLEQVHLVGPSLMYGYDLSTLLSKMAADMADSQEESGLVPDIAPEFVKFEGGFRDSPEWGSAYVLVPWNCYQWYGDVEILRRHYAGMQRYVAYLGSKAKGHILSHGLADWFALDQTSTESTATAFYYLDLRVLEQTARLLGKSADTGRYARLAADVQAAYNARLLKNGSYGSQTANALPVAMGITPSADAPGVLEAIVTDIRKRGNSLTSGDVGYRYLLRALARNGRSDVILDMNSRSDKPGYAMILAKGNTSLTEPWDGGPSASSNHFMLGHIMEWFFADLAGIQCDPAAPAYRRICIKPQVVGDLTWVYANYDCPYGRIVSQWKRDGDKLTMDVIIPPNTTAMVFVPAKNGAAVTEGGKPAGQAAGVRFVKFERDRAIFEIGSGEYHFAS